MEVPRPSEERPAATLLGETGRETEKALVDLSLGRITLEEAGPSFFRPEGGGIGLVVDRATWEAFGFSEEP
ncbi:hypothetical protein A3D14_01655 [Candidatus Saccharibacteria bacterium RIFCSPHIGHO2_02_FULL_47_12]|nr:MAG: hypothetical protein A3D14_01655 [Candidatus Saccharibacteria bacterium RIFCSPHIGHO2_02_FULL_47_12]